MPWDLLIFCFVFVWWVFVLAMHMVLGSLFLSNPLMGLNSDGLGCVSSDPVVDSLLLRTGRQDFCYKPASSVVIGQGASWCYVSFLASFFIPVLVVSLFLWLGYVLLSLMVFFVSVVWFVYRDVIMTKRFDNLYCNEARPLSFWLFIASEALLFGSLFVAYLSYYEGEAAISDSMEYPLLGCALLLFSSFWATFYHHQVSACHSYTYRAGDLDVLGYYAEASRSCVPWLWEPWSLSSESYFMGSNVVLDGVYSEQPWYRHFSGYISSIVSDSFFVGRVSLYITIVFGGFFVLLQCVEFSGCTTHLTSSAVYSAAYSIVSLHFSHVVIGLLLLCIIASFGGVFKSYYYSSLAVWYWHFVDYVWLWVYLLIYYTV